MKVDDIITDLVNQAPVSRAELNEVIEQISKEFERVNQAILELTKEKQNEQ